MILTTPTIVALMLIPCVSDQSKEPAVAIAEAKKDANGFLIHEVQSPYQAGKTAIRVLLPDRLEKDKRYPVIYLLPVEARDESRFGNGLLEVKKLDLANKVQVIFVAPTFSHLPWYADHPSKADVRQETYLMKVVVPFIEKTYPAKAEASGRLLLGFSKSGWGAFSLLLRHPDVFGKAAAWDAPLMMDQPNRFGMGEIFGDQENFEKYQITRLLQKRAADLQKDKRLLLVGFANFKDHHEQAGALLKKLAIAYEHRAGPARKHDWHSGWVPEAVELLLAGTPKKGDGDRP